MAKIFLDANFYIDIIEERQEVSLDDFVTHELLISSLSIHIHIYLYKHRMPNKKLADFLETFIIVPADKKIATHSLAGPTDDFEDNVQLHSAAEAECDLLLTRDEKLLKMKFFGKIEIVDNMYIMY